MKKKIEKYIDENTIYMNLNIAQESIKKIYKDETEKIPCIFFKNELNGLEKINDKEYHLHIRSNLFLINGSKLLIENSDDKYIPNLEDLRIHSSSQAITKIPILKFDLGYTNNKHLYLITEYYKLKLNDVIEIKFKDKIENPEFFLLEILSII